MFGCDSCASALPSATARPQLGIARRDELERDLARELGVPRDEHRATAAGADVPPQLVAADAHSLLRTEQLRCGPRPHHGAHVMIDLRTDRSHPPTSGL